MRHKGQQCDVTGAFDGLGERALVPTGLSIALPDGYVALVHPRSGLAARHGLSIVNAPGTVDAGYRGEIKVVQGRLMERSEVLELMAKPKLFGMRAAYDEVMATVREHIQRQAAALMANAVPLHLEPPPGPTFEHGRSASAWVTTNRARAMRPWQPPRAAA